MPRMNFASSDIRSGDHGGSHVSSTSTASTPSISLVMCTRCNWVRFVDGVHFFVRERREEVRLLGY